MVSKSRNCSMLVVRGGARDMFVLEQRGKKKILYRRKHVGPQFLNPLVVFRDALIHYLEKLQR